MATQMDGSDLMALAEVVQGAGLTLADIAADRERFALIVVRYFDKLKAVIQDIEALDQATCELAPGG